MPSTRLLADTHHGVLVTLRSNGRPQLSNVSHTFDPGTRLVRVSVTDTRAKVRNCAPRSAGQLPRDQSRLLALGGRRRHCRADASRDRSAATPPSEELIEIYRAIAGSIRTGTISDGPWSPIDGSCFRLRVERIYGNGLTHSAGSRCRGSRSLAPG